MIFATSSLLKTIGKRNRYSTWGIFADPYSRHPLWPFLWQGFNLHFSAFLPFIIPPEKSQAFHKKLEFLKVGRNVLGPEKNTIKLSTAWRTEGLKFLNILKN